MKPWLKWTLISGGSIIGIWLVLALILGLTGYTGRLHEREAQDRAAAASSAARATTVAPTSATAPPLPITTTPFATTILPPIATTAPVTTTAALPSSAPASTTTATPVTSAGGCALKTSRDMLIWQRVPRLSDTVIRVGDVDVIHCQPTLNTWRAGQPDGPGYCSRIAWADDNPGYDETRVPAAPLAAVLDQFGGSC